MVDIRYINCAYGCSKCEQCDGCDAPAMKYTKDCELCLSCRIIASKDLI